MPRHRKDQNARTRPHRPVGDLQALRRKMWQAVIEAEALPSLTASAPPWTRPRSADDRGVPPLSSPRTTPC